MLSLQLEMLLLCTERFDLALTLHDAMRTAVRREVSKHMASENLTLPADQTDPTGEFVVKAYPAFERIDRIAAVQAFIHQRTKRRIPSSTVVAGRKPVAASRSETSAMVWGTSPGCIGR